MKGILFVVSGPSGVGKGTILDVIIKENQNIKFSVSATTRNPRPGEIDGTHYCFIKRSEFENLVSESKFLEWAKVHDELYGTLRHAVENDINKGYDVILDIDVKGALQLIEKKEDAVYIFIAPPDIKELEKRLKGRMTEKNTQISGRLEVAKWEMSKINCYEYIIVNDVLSKACEDLASIIKAEKLKTKRSNYKHY